MENYKEAEEYLGNYDDEPHVPYNLKQDKATQLIYDRLEQLNREVQMDFLSPKVREYHYVRIDELQTLLRLFEIKK